MSGSPTAPSILVVQDEHSVAGDLKTTLLRLGYAVPAMARFGEEALVKARKLKPDLVLTDVFLCGKLDGIAVGDELHRMQVPVIYLTSFADDATLERARLTEPYGYLLKPLNERELHSTIEMALWKAASDRQQLARGREFENALQSLGEALITADAHGCVTTMNAAAEALTGWPATEAVGRSLSEVCLLVREREDEPGDDLDDDPDDVEISAALLRERTATVLRTREGRHVAVEEETAPIVDRGGGGGGLVVVLRPVGQRLRAQARIALHERLESLATLVGGLSHEINNPLCIVMANLDCVVRELSLLEASSDEDGPLALAAGTARRNLVSKCLQAAMDGAGRIRQIVADLRNFTQPAACGKRPCDLATILRTAALLSHSEVEKRARFRVDVRALPVAHGHEARLVQAFAGILSAAASSITSDNAEEQEVRLEAWTDPRGCAVVVVSDTGRPLQPREHRHVFDPFYVRGDERGANHGLALWISHRVLLEHHAEIRVESKASRGNQYIVCFEEALTSH